MSAYLITNTDVTDNTISVLITKIRASHSMQAAFSILSKARTRFSTSVRAISSVICLSLFTFMLLPASLLTPFLV